MAYHCKECGRKLTGEETECPSCGYPLDLDETSAVQSQTDIYPKIRAIAFIVIGAIAFWNWITSGTFKSDNAIGHLANQINFMILLLALILLVIGITNLLKINSGKN